MNLIITRKYQAFSLIECRYKALYFVVKWFFIGNNNNIIRHIDGSNGLLSTVLGAIEIKTANYFFYEDLYLNQMQNVNGFELSRIVRSFIDGVATNEDSKHLNNIKLHIATFFLNGHLQYIEFLYQKIKASSIQKYCGSHLDHEYLILKDVARNQGAEVALIKNNLNLPIVFFEGLYRFLGKFINPSDTPDNFFSSKVLIPSIKEKTIVIGFLESRRIDRIQAITRGLERLGYKVLYYCSNQKIEDTLIAKNDLEFSKKLVLDSDILPKKIILKERRSASKSMKGILNALRANSENSQCEYRGVKIFKYCLKGLEDVIRYRYLQSRLSSKGIEALSENVNIVAYISMDCSVSSSTCINYFRSRGTPTFFYLYNPFQSEAFYTGVLSLLRPSCWLVAGDIQRAGLIKTVKQKLGEAEIKVVGDVGSEDKIKDKVRLPSQEANRGSGKHPKKRVVLALSSYISHEFTTKIKRTYFQSIYLSTRDLDVSLVIKPHPNEDAELLRAHLREWGVDATVLNFMSIEYALELANLVVMQFSEAAFAAFKKSIPVISICTNNQLASFDMHWSFYSSRAVRHVELGELFADLISELMYGEKSRDRLIKDAAKYLKTVIKYSGNEAVNRLCNEMHQKILK